MLYVGISTYLFLPYTHTCILKPFEDSEPTGLKVDIANLLYKIDIDRTA